MTVTLSPERKDKIFQTASGLGKKDTSTVRELAHFIGMVVAVFQGVKYGPLWYRGMEKDKTNTLNGNSDMVILTQWSGSMMKLRWK